MVGPTQGQALENEAKQVSAALDALIPALHDQRATLRQYGMSLPPGTLSGFRVVQGELSQLVERLHERGEELKRLRALADTAMLINSSLDLDEVLKQAMDTVIALAGAERGYIMLRDDDTGEMVFRVARYFDAEALDDDSLGVSRTIVDQVIASGRPIVTTNAQSDPRFAEQDSVMFYALRSILCVPLVVRDAIIGVVYADNRIRDALFGEDELTLLVTFANQAAVAIENARLFARLQGGLAEVREVKELMDSVLASIASGVITLDDVGVVTLYNAAAAAILDVPPDAVQGQPLRAALPVVHEVIEDALPAVFARGESAALEANPQLARRGPVNLSLRLSPLRNGDQIEGVAIVVDDLTAIRQRDATLSMVQRYLPPAMVDHIESLDELGLGGERRLISVAFVETPPFDSFDPSLRAAALLERINLYLSVGADAIHAHTGVVDKFMGNEMLGLFNTPLNPGDDHAWQAVQAALQMLDEYAALAQRLGEPPRACRIGVHSGEATLGNVGNATRREFTAIGDTINLAKRIQEHAADNQVIISEDTYRQCRARFEDPAWGVRVLEHATIQVRGRRQPVTIYEVQRAP